MAEKVIYFKVAENSYWCLCFIHLFSKTLDLSVLKNGHKLVNNTNFGFLIVKLTYRCHGNMNKCKQAFKIDFVYLQKIQSLDFLYNLHATSL